MSVDIDQIMKKAAAYVAETQPLLDKAAAEKRAWDTQAQRTAAVLADRGCLKREKVSDFVEKISENPANALLFLEKVARLVGAEQLGAPATDVKVAAADDDVDPFVRAYCPELMAVPGTVE